MGWFTSSPATAILIGVSVVLLYHPMLDPYHCALRVLGLLSDAEMQQIEWDRLRLLDFLIVFPHTLKQMRLPSEYRSRRSALRSVPEPYELLPNMTRLFYQVSELQTGGVRLLAASELIGKEALEHGHIRISVHKDDQVQALATAMNELHYRSEDWYAFVIECLVRYPLNGRGGLKERTGLMEHRHDTD